MASAEKTASGWEDVANAEAYARFCDAFPMYRERAADLVRVAGVGDATAVLDLACGTGVSTAAVLNRLPARSGHVVAADMSSAMLSVARREVVDPRIRWLHCPMERVGEHVVAAVEVAVCSAAIWQSDLRRTFSAVHRALEPGGRFVFNIGERFLPTPPNGTPAPSLFQLALAIAERDHGVVARRGPGAASGRPVLTVDTIRESLAATGFSLTGSQVVEYPHSLAQQASWLSIPIFTEQYLPQLSPEQRAAAVRAAYDRLASTHTAATSRAWTVFVAHRDSGQRAAMARA